MGPLVLVDVHAYSTGGSKPHGFKTSWAVVLRCRNEQTADLQQASLELVALLLAYLAARGRGENAGGWESIVLVRDCVYM
jgi:hypothetical protein